MRVLLDESCCLSLARVLRDDGHEVFSISETGRKGTEDDQVWDLTCRGPYLLVTRDYHFTNSVRFPAEECLGVLFVRHGNLKARDEAELVRSFLAKHPLDEFKGALIVLSPGAVRIRR